MRLTQLRWSTLTLLVMISVLTLWLWADRNAGSILLAQTARVDPVQALIALQAQERLNTLNAAIGAGSKEQAAGAGQSAMAAQADKYVRITDAAETMMVEVPAAWTDIEDGPWLYNGENVGFYLTASPDLGKFNGDLTEPGLFFGVSTTLLARYPEQEILNLEATRLQRINKDCRKQPEIKYEDPFYQGKYHLFDSCRKQSGHFYFSHVTTPPNRAYVIVLRINFPNGAHTQVVKRIYDSFQVLGTPGLDEHH